MSFISKTEGDIQPVSRLIGSYSDPCLPSIDRSSVTPLDPVEFKARTDRTLELLKSKVNEARERQAKQPANLRLISQKNGAYICQRHVSRPDVYSPMERTRRLSHIGLEHLRRTSGDVNSVDKPEEEGVGTYNNIEGPQKSKSGVMVKEDSTVIVPIEKFSRRDMLGKTPRSPAETCEPRLTNDEINELLEPLTPIGCYSLIKWVKNLWGKGVGIPGTDYLAVTSPLVNRVGHSILRGELLGVILSRLSVDSLIELESALVIHWRRLSAQDETLKEWKL